MANDCDTFYSSDSIGSNRSQPGNFWLCVAANERIVASTPHSAAQPQPLSLQLSGTVMVCNKRCAHIHSLAACSTKVCGVSAICNWVSNIIIITSLCLGKSLRCAALLFSAHLCVCVCVYVCASMRARECHICLAELEQMCARGLPLTSCPSAGPGQATPRPFSAASLCLCEAVAHPSLDPLPVCSYYARSRIITVRNYHSPLATRSAQLAPFVAVRR